jgi:SAM-dependent methyltransferase
VNKAENRTSNRPLSRESIPSYQEFRKLVDSYLEDHPESRWHLEDSALRTHATIVAAADHLHSGGRVVDMGCLPANLPLGFHILNLLDSIEYHGTCIESSEDPMSQCATSLGIHLHQINLDPTFDIFPEISRLPAHVPLEDASVDVIILTEVLEHLVWPHSVIQEASRLLRPGGILVGTTPNATNIGSVVKAVLGKGTLEWYEESHLSSEQWIKHVRFYGFRDLSLLFEEHGLQLTQSRFRSWESLYGGHRGLKTWIKKTLRTASYIIPWYREGLFFVGKKRQ